MKNRVRLFLVLSFCLFLGFAPFVARGEGGGEVEFFPQELPNPQPPLESIQDYWDIFNVSNSVRESYLDGAAWLPGEDLLFFQYRLAQIDLGVLEPWRRPQSDLDAFDNFSAFELNRQRFDLFHLRGTLKNMTKLRAPEEALERYGVSEYFLCDVELASGRTIHLFCSQIPRHFLKFGKQTPEGIQVGANAIFLKKGEGNSFYMLTTRLAWYPDSELGNAEFDYGLLDDLDREEPEEDAKSPRRRDMRLTMRNRECFYQMMAAAARISSDEYEEIIQKNRENAPKERFEPETSFSSVRPFFSNPLAERGNFFHLHGLARRITMVRVDDEDIQNRFGITHYYEIWMYCDEAPQQPIAILTTSLPPELSPGGGSGFYADISVPVFFFNTWTYKGRDEKGETISRYAPLLIGSCPKLTQPGEPFDWFWFNVISITLFSSIMAICTVFYCYSTHKDEFFRRREHDRRFSLPNGQSLNEVGWDVVAEPDFTNWGAEPEPEPEPKSEDSPTSENVEEKKNSKNSDKSNKSKKKNKSKSKKR
ncbi:MAG: hypothetical protein Q4D38_05425 [Planctomycetia bacterium]|nr:hypothetical protein [Planctomycetia bacterium]